MAQPARMAGTFLSWMRSASPSTMAVLPTPGSPTKTGLFLRRRQSTWMVRSISESRPTSGSICPLAARSTRLTVKARKGSFTVCGGPSSSPSPASPPSPLPAPGRERPSPSLVTPWERYWRMSMRRMPCFSIR